MTVAEKVEKALAARQWSQSKLARAAGTTPPSISRIVNGAEPAAGLAFRIAKALEIPIAWLLDDARDWPPPSDASGHSAADCLDRAIILKRRIAAIYAELQSAFDGVSKGMESGDRDAARSSAKRLVDLCVEHADAIDEWYRFAARWNGIKVYCDASPDWTTGAQLDATMADLLGTDPTDIPRSLRYWYSDCSDWVGIAKECGSRRRKR